jgi:hypothetical protein
MTVPFLKRFNASPHHQYDCLFSFILLFESMKNEVYRNFIPDGYIPNRIHNDRAFFTTGHRMELAFPSLPHREADGEIEIHVRIRIATLRPI